MLASGGLAVSDMRVFLVSFHLAGFSVFRSCFCGVVVR